MSLLTHNLLVHALRIIPSSQVQVFHFTENTITEGGQSVPSYEDLGTFNGSIQGVTNELYAELGLDFQKEYKKVFVPTQLNGSDTQTTPDYVSFYGSNWTVFKSNKWTEYDGWDYAIVVRQITNGN